MTQCGLVDVPLALTDMVGMIVTKNVEAVTSEVVSERDVFSLRLPISR